MSILYFAYGSNMDRDRMLKRGVKIFSESIGYIKMWKLVFNKKAPNKGEGYANIVPNKNSKVYGVIYEIEETDILKLDEYEGYPTHYDRQAITVIRSDGTEIKAQVYIAKNDMTDTNLKPSKSYMQYILNGARQHNLPEEYIDFLEKAGGLKNGTY
ncbi:MAG: gamma-glutamylcyclotransferase family protein [Candidatus Micrarchaeia archaeon]